MGLTKDQHQLLAAARTVARDLGEHGKSLTGLIGELSARSLFDLSWDPETGYDARDSKNNRIQIKTRKSWSTERVNPVGRLGKFGRAAGYQFDSGIYVELDHKFDVLEVWELDVDGIKALELNRSETEKKRGLHVGEFVKCAERVWSSSN